MKISWHSYHPRLGLKHFLRRMEMVLNNTQVTWIWCPATLNLIESYSYQHTKIPLDEAIKIQELF